MAENTEIVPNAEGQNETDKTKAASDTAEGTENKEIEEKANLDKRLEKVENRLDQVISHQDMQKSATEMFESVKSLLDAMKSNSENVEAAHNKFVQVLAPGNAPEGSPQNFKDLVDAVSKISERWKERKWTPNKT